MHGRYHDLHGADAAQVFCHKWTTHHVAPLRVSRNGLKQQQRPDFFRRGAARAIDLNHWLDWRHGHHLPSARANHGCDMVSRRGRFVGCGMTRTAGIQLRGNHGVPKDRGAASVTVSSGNPCQYTLFFGVSCYPPTFLLIATLFHLQCFRPTLLAHGLWGLPAPPTAPQGTSSWPTPAPAPGRGPTGAFSPR